MGNFQEKFPRKRPQERSSMLTQSIRKIRHAVLVADHLTRMPNPQSHEYSGAWKPGRRYDLRPRYCVILNEPTGDEEHAATLSDDEPEEERAPS